MDIRELLKKPESKTLEFKKDLSSLNPILKTIVAFANTAGGILVIGKSDQGEIVGLNDLQHQQDKLANSIADNIRPILFPEFEFFTIDKKNLLIVQVHHIPAPFYLKQEGKRNGVYLRLGATSRQAPPEFISEIKRRLSNQYYDEEPCSNTRESDLDFDLIHKAFSNKPYKMTTEKLITLKILCDYEGKKYPTNGGMLLFGKEEKRLSIFPNAEISCARFSGTTKADFIDRMDITNSFLFAIDEIPKFIRRNTRMAAEIADIKRKDVPEYPTKAIREILINALIHANYELKGSRFYIAIYDDRIEIQNPGNFPPGMTIDDFQAGVSKIRNPMIARIFREKEKLEAWGSGYQRICTICETNGYPLPKWEEIGSILRVTLYPRLLPAEFGTKLAPSRHQVVTKLSPSSHQVVTKLALSSEQYKILSFCKKPRKIQEIQDFLQLKDRTHFRNRYLNPLINSTLLEMTYPESPHSPKQSYKTTALGDQQL